MSRHFVQAPFCVKPVFHLHLKEQISVKLYLEMQSFHFSLKKMPWTLLFAKKKFQTQKFTLCLFVFQVKLWSQSGLRVAVPSSSHLSTSSTTLSGPMRAPERNSPIINWWRWAVQMRPRQNGRHFPDDIFGCLFLNENCCILIKISLKFCSPQSNWNIPALVQIMAWHRSGAKPLSEPMMV